MSYDVLIARKHESAAHVRSFYFGEFAACWQTDNAHKGSGPAACIVIAFQIHGRPDRGPQSLAYNCPGLYTPVKEPAQNLTFDRLMRWVHAVDGEAASRSCDLLPPASMVGQGAHAGLHPHIRRPQQAQPLALPKCLWHHSGAAGPLPPLLRPPPARLHAGHRLCRRGCGCHVRPGLGGQCSAAPLGLTPPSLGPSSVSVSTCSVHMQASGALLSQLQPGSGWDGMLSSSHGLEQPSYAAALRPILSACGWQLQLPLSFSVVTARVAWAICCRLAFSLAS